MKKKTNSVVLQATFILVLVTFLSTIFLANANNSFAASHEKKSQATTRSSAVEHTEAQIKQLQGTLNITAAQKPLWDNLTQVMRDNAKEMDALNKEKAEQSKTMTAVEHMKYHSEITQSHSSQMNKLIPPFEAFYDSLSDQQKNITNIVFRTGKHGKAKRR